MDWKNSTMWRLFMLVLAVLALAAFSVQAAFSNGRSNIYSNAKSMHFTRNKHSLTWTSIFPTRVYTESQAAKFYRTVDGVLDKMPASAADVHGFQIAVGFGILTNVSPYVYISALVVIAFLSTMDVVWNGKQHAPKNHIYFQWLTIGVIVVFGLVYLTKIFYTFTHLDWGAKETTPVSYSWESGYSLLWAAPVVLLYIVHLNTKHSEWSPIVSGVWPDGKEHTAHGPKSKEATIIFAVSFFLFAMALLGDIRSTVLESEAQLVVISAVSVAVVTVLSMRVRAYFDYVQVFMSMPEMEQHAKMVAHALALVDVITLAVVLVLVGVTFNVLGYMNAASVYWLFWAVFSVLGLFLAFQILETVFGMYFTYHQYKDHELKKWMERAFALQYSATIFLIIVFSFVHSNESHLSEKLRTLENSQYASMSAVDLRPNTLCTNAGVQSNSLLKTFLDLESSKKFKDISPDWNNPVNFKVWAWTRWWQLEAGAASTLDAKYYLCSVGMEQVFGECRAQYATTPGKALDDTFKTFANTIQLDVAPT